MTQDKINLKTLHDLELVQLQLRFSNEIRTLQQNLQAVEAELFGRASAFVKEESSDFDERTTNRNK